MSTTDPQQNVDAIRKILFGQEQQQIEQKISQLNEQLTELQSKLQTQGQDHLSLTSAMNQARQDLESSAAQLDEQQTSRLDTMEQALQSLHVDMNSKLASYATQTNEQIKQLSAALDQAQGRIKQLEGKELAMRNTMSQSFSQLASFFKQ
jgi:chromosome segregation ATPase